MYFIRETSAVNPNKGRKNLDDYFTDFNFTGQIYKDKILSVRNIHNDDKTLVPDIAGSVVKHLFLGGWFAQSQKSKDKKKNYLVERGLECCSSIIQNIGFSVTTADIFFKKLNSIDSKTTNVMLVAGCQKTPMLKSRVERAVEIAMNVTKELNIVFSGENPSIKGFDDLDCLSEAIDMKRFFDDLWHTKRKSYPPNIKFHLERESHNTKKNIENVFTGGFGDKKKELNIIIVSSTFHLIRFSQDIENFITQNKHDTKVKNILLAGGESTTKILLPNPDDAHYVKGMFKDIFEYLFTVNKAKTYTTAIV